MKTCSKCKETKPFEGFYKDRTKADGCAGTCKGCRRTYARQYYKDNLEKVAEYREKNYDRIQAFSRQYERSTRYGLAEGAFVALLSSQGNGCAVCGTSTPGGKGSWHIDHDHSCCSGRKACGKCVRGVLCSGCNLAIGHAKERPETLRALARYIERHSVKERNDT